jgi:peptidoglycan hydrolase-like protein with peptidoglycan-binding domain
MIIPIDIKNRRVAQFSPNLNRVQTYLKGGSKQWSGFGDWLPNLNPFNWGTEGTLLKLGSTGYPVRVLGFALSALGYTVTYPISDNFDDTLNTAVQNFQSNQQIEIDGKVGHTTWTAIETALSSIGTSINDIKNTIGITSGTISVTPPYDMSAFTVNKDVLPDQTVSSSTGPSSSDIISNIPVIGPILKTIIGGVTTTPKTTTTTTTQTIAGMSPTKLFEYLAIGGLSLFVMLMVINKIKESKSVHERRMSEIRYLPVQAPVGIPVGQQTPKVITKPLSSYGKYSRRK